MNQRDARSASNLKIVFRALASDKKRRMLQLVCSQERHVSDLAAQTGLRQIATSQHLRQLAMARLVTVREEGRRSYYKLCIDGLLPVLDFLHVLRLAKPMPAIDKSNIRKRIAELRNSFGAAKGQLRDVIGVLDSLSSTFNNLR